MLPRLWRRMAKSFSVFRDIGVTDQDLPHSSGSRFPNDLWHQTTETYQQVVAELGDDGFPFSWSVPPKEASKRVGVWEYSVASTALPDHSLRIKQPTGLGVDDVKQVIGVVE
jgi:hypothetical protein